MPRKSNPKKLALQKYSGLSRQAVHKRFKLGIGTTAFHDHLCRKMRACADIAEHKAASLKIEVARLKDSITTREEVARDAQAVATIWIEEINRMREEAVAQLVNLDEVGVRASLDSLTDQMMDRIMDRMERL
ncbi:MAG: hypothetical protein K8R57_02960 [Verrucomicrobia bacterium]|nr:hypothetical protein [Verrucomicrobiota bacterium]